MEQSHLRPELQLLLEASRSEVKRWGGSEVGLLHLAAAVSRRWPDEYAGSFGVNESGLVDGMLRTQVAAGSEQDVLELLATCDGPAPIAAVVSTLRERLGPLLQKAVEEAAPDTHDAPATPDAPVTGVRVGSGPPEQAADRVDGASPEWEVAQRSARFVEVLGLDDTQAVVSREGLVDDITSLIARRTTGVPLLLGPKGVGKTSVMRAFAARIAEPTYDGPLAGRKVVRVLAERVLAADGETTLARILEDLTDDIVFVDDVDSLTNLGGSHPLIGVLLRLRAATAEDRCLVLAAREEIAGRIDVHDSALWTMLAILPVPELALPDLESVIGRESKLLAEFHDVKLPPEVVSRALVPPGSETREVHPGLAVSRLDNACVRARMRPDRTATTDDLDLARTSEQPTFNRRQVTERLSLRVLGQESSVELVANRLALTTANLDLRPERPDGVFLFVGPTGVGKTEMAKAVSAEVFGGEAPLIRLDMSEYAHDWAVSRLVGPAPGYIGSTEPESWLTTRVAAAPRSVVLLDEIEKAHPTIWNTFLQVFDAGRLTDGRGTTADFSQAIVIMTSNIGATAFSQGALGFAGESQKTIADEAKVRDAVKQTMAPELLNRLDAVVVFRPLSARAIHDIARKEVSAVSDSMISRGYHLDVSDEIVELVATTGYDPAYGARHLLRNIESMLLQQLVDHQPNRLRAVRDGDTVVWHAVEGTAANGREPDPR